MEKEKLTLTHQGAESLRDFARALPIATEDIKVSTEKLYNIFKSLSEDLGEHKDDFEKLLLHIDKLQTETTEAINQLVPKMLKTADKIDEYVSFDPTNATSFEKDSTISYTPPYASRYSTPSYHLSRASYSMSDVAKFLGKNVSDLYDSTTGNKQNKLYHEFSDSIKHPQTRELLEATNGYYVSNGQGQMECVYAEFQDKNGNTYCYTKYNGKSILSQMREDGIFDSESVDGLVSDAVKLSKNTPWNEIKGPHSFGFDLRMSNPNYRSGERKWKRNCQRCVPAFEMRRRGFDVQAKPRPSDFLNSDYLAKHPYSVWQNPNILKTEGNGKIDIETKFKEWGDGARAQIVVYWNNFKGGHTFIATQTDGVVRYYDPQTEDYDVSRYFNSVAIGETTFCRIDNLEPSSRIKDCCQERKI